MKRLCDSNILSFDVNLFRFSLLGHAAHHLSDDFKVFARHSPHFKSRFTCMSFKITHIQTYGPAPCTIQSIDFLL